MKLTHTVRVDFFRINDGFENNDDKVFSWQVFVPLPRDKEKNIHF